MIREPTLFRRLLHLALAVVFVLGMGMEASGLRHCPMHDVSPDGPGVRAAGTAATSAVAGSGPTRDDGASHSHDDGPCTCLGDCDVQGSAPAQPTDPALLGTVPPARVVSGLEADRPLLRGPRHGLFELHRPNAPPLILS